MARGQVSQSKQDPLIMGRQIAGASRQPAHEFSITHAKRQLCTDRVPITLHAHEAESDPGILLAYVISQQHWSVADAGKDCVWRAVVVPITDRQSARKVAF